VVVLSVDDMQKVYQHYNNKKYYKIVDWCKIQEEGKWVDAYIYKENTPSFGEYRQKFVRTITEFHQKFMPVMDEEEYMKTSDGISLLDSIRNEQLYSLLGKYKIF